MLKSKINCRRSGSSGTEAEVAAVPKKQKKRALEAQKMEESQKKQKQIAKHKINKKNQIANPKGIDRRCICCISRNI